MAPRLVHDLAGIGAARAVVAHAFVTDPMLRWVYRDLDDEQRREATAAWLGIFVDAFGRRGRVHVLDEPTTTPEAPTGTGEATVAVSVWRPASQTGPEFAELPTLGGLLGAIVGTARLEQLGQGFSMLGELHPHDQHAYLQLLAVVPPCQGRGLGRLVLQPCLDACDRAGEQLYLETMTERNVRFYRSLGFEVTGEAQLPFHGPTAWGMVRPPTALRSS